jgi:hypothetical protein
MKPRRCVLSRSPANSHVHAGAARMRLGGQALTEFLTLAVAIIPLYLLIPVIAKYQDVASQVEMASRYVAFEAMTRNDSQSTWKTPAELAGEVRRRFFSNSEAPIKTGDTAGNFLANQNLFWRGPDGTSLIKDFDTDVLVSFGPNRRPTHADAFTPANDGAPFNGIAGAAVGINTAQELGLNAQGIYTGNVTVQLANLPAGLKAYEPFDSINLAISRHTSVAINGWQAKNPAQVQTSIDSALLVPATNLRGVASAVNATVTVVEATHIGGPKLGQLDFWSDVVPPDRTQ